MNTQKFVGYGVLIGVITIALVYLIGAYIGMERREEEAPTLTTEEDAMRELSGTVTLVNQDEIAFDGPSRITFVTPEGKSYEIALPSMGRTLCAAVDTVTPAELIVVGDTLQVKGDMTEEGVIVPCEDASHYVRVVGHVNADDIGIQFAYRKGPDGYRLSVEDTNASTYPAFVRSYNLMLERDYIELQKATAPREGPPTLGVHVYRNTEKLSPHAWALAHPLESNIELIFEEPTATTVGGVAGVQYTVNGLYAIATYVFTHGEYTYLITGAYSEQDSVQRADIEALVESISFTAAKG